MTLFLDFRTAGEGGGILDEPRVLEDNGLVDPLVMRNLSQAMPAARNAGREVVFVTHGFNVSRRDGVHALARLERDLNLPPAFVLVGVLWPADWRIQVVNDPPKPETPSGAGVSWRSSSTRSLSSAGEVSSCRTASAGGWYSKP